VDGSCERYSPLERNEACTLRAESLAVWLFFGRYFVAVPSPPSRPTISSRVLPIDVGATIDDGFHAA